MTEGEKMLWCSIYAAHLVERRRTRRTDNYLEQIWDASEVATLGVRGLKREVGTIRSDWGDEYADTVVEVLGIKSKKE